MRPGMPRVRGLDGLRGVAVALLLCGHAAGTRVAGAGGARVPLALDGLGDVGVRLFFVLSGFLITSLLLGEMETSNDIALGRFWARRGLRIVPAAYAYVGVMAALAAVGVVWLAPGDRLHAVTYTVNYHHARSWLVSHLWSLGVEEQFYLLWPLVLLVAGARDGLRVAAALVVAAPFVRVLMWVHLPAQRKEIGEAFFTAADALATGCLLAGARARLDASPRVAAFLRSPAFLVVPALAVVATLLQDRVFVDLPLGQTVLNVCLAVLAYRVVRLPEAPSSRLLAARGPVALGVLSYSLYLWQQPFLDRFATHALAVFPLNLLCAFAAAAVSYAVVERPLLRLRAAEIPSSPWIGQDPRASSRTSDGRV